MASCNLPTLQKEEFVTLKVEFYPLKTLITLVISSLLSVTLVSSVLLSRSYLLKLHLFPLFFLDPLNLAYIYLHVWLPLHNHTLEYWIALWHVRKAEIQNMLVYYKYNFSPDELIQSSTFLHTVKNYKSLTWKHTLVHHLLLENISIGIDPLHYFFSGYLYVNLLFGYISNTLLIAFHKTNNN